MKKYLIRLTGESVKILIIGFAKIKYMPYLSLYLNNIDTSSNDVHILYWDRDTSPDKPLPDNITVHTFNEILADEIPKIAKIKAFIDFRKNAKEIIKKNKFDFIIVLTSVPAVLLSGILLGEYKEKYIFDYRDYTFEKLLPYKKCIAKLVENSAMTVYSSEKHLDFLPESEKLHVAYNFIKASVTIKNQKPFKQIGKGDSIRISYWGLLRNEGFNRKVIDKFANDSRFLINFYGKKQQVVENLEKYCIENKISNVKFYGEYQEEDRYRFAAETDLLYNLYDVTGTEGMAMGNKFFDGAIFRIPQICTKGSYMGEKVEEYGIGRAFDIDSDEFADMVYRYYTDIEETQFTDNCQRLMKRVLIDFESTEENIRTYCREQ